MYEESVSEIATKFELNSVYVFGSWASEVARYVTSGVTLDAANRSNVDIAVQPRRDIHLSAQQRAHLMQAFEGLFGASRVDLVILPEANSLLALDAIRGELLYCYDLHAQAEEELYYLRKAADLAPMQRQMWAALYGGAFMIAPSQLRAVVVQQRVTRIREMIAALRALPVASFDEFLADSRNVATAESYVRRALESVLDLGRHILTKGFGVDATEYKEVAAVLVRVGVVNTPTGAVFRTLAGYRNRLVHFYHEVTQRELFDITVEHVQDIEKVLDALLAWVHSHPDRIDHAL